MLSRAAPAALPARSIAQHRQHRLPAASRPLVATPTAGRGVTAHAAMKAAYCVLMGAKTGVFTSWAEVKPLIEGFSGAQFK
jgi:hypothetical protein